MVHLSLSFQEQVELERIGRTKTQLAAAEAVAKLQSCQYRREELLQKVAVCQEEQNINREVQQTQWRR